VIAAMRSLSLDLRHLAIVIEARVSPQQMAFIHMKQRIFVRVHHVFWFQRHTCFFVSEINDIIDEFMEKFWKRYLACYYVSVCNKSNAYLQVGFQKNFLGVRVGKRRHDLRRGKLSKKCQFNFLFLIQIMLKGIQMEEVRGMYQ